MDRYVVIGNPVEHSISPRIHAWFAAATGQTLTYERLLAPLGGFAETAERFFADGGKGANVTVPFKADAARWVDALDSLASAAAAVNTILQQADGRRIGFNTDGLGLARDLTTNLGVNLAGARVLLIGAGGAASGVVGPLLDGGVAALVIGNRTVSRAQALARHFRQLRPDAPVVSAAFAALEGRFDVVINATSAGLDDEVPALDPGRLAGAVCYDMVYGHSTAFCRWAQAAGAALAVDGLGMLVEQAAEAFSIWRGVRPDTRPLMAELKAERARSDGA